MVPCAVIKVVAQPLVRILVKLGKDRSPFQHFAELLQYVKRYIHMQMTGMLAITPFGVVTSWNTWSYHRKFVKFLHHFIAYSMIKSNQLIILLYRTLPAGYNAADTRAKGIT